MKHLILSLASLALLANCTNSKKVADIPTSHQVTPEVSDIKTTLEIAATVIDSSLWIDTGVTSVDTTIVGYPITFQPITGWGEYPPYVGWGGQQPYEYFWLTGSSTISFFIMPDTLEENLEIPKDYFTSGKNCYSIIPDETGASFEMEVVEEEIVQVSITQFGDCKSHLPLNVSWLNTPLVMKKGRGSIQLNYPKHYALDLQIDFKGTLGKQSIQIQS
ncbi:MAG: hypothetical protein ACI857_000439 [Arenicella sp.]|jgi:hypothetical protein